MATIYNSDLTKELVKAGKIQTSRENAPNQLADKVVPVMEVNPRLLRYCTVIGSNAAVNALSATVASLSADKDFYLCGAAMNVCKDGTALSTTSALNVTLKGKASGTVLLIKGLSGYGETLGSNTTFNPPLALERGTLITVTNNDATANVSAGATIWGYYDDVSNA